MKGAAEKMKDKIINTKFLNPSTDIVSNVTAEAESSIENIKNLNEITYSIVR